MDKARINALPSSCGGRVHPVPNQGRDQHGQEAKNRGGNGH
jgi:hypothetical protein